MANSGITIDIIGDSGPFSLLGKSIGYRLRVGDSQFLLDCGAPVFQLLGQTGLSGLDGLIITHSHEDHKRWFTDIALYNHFSNKSGKKLNLYGSDKIMGELQASSVFALQKTLGPASKQVVNVEFEEYFDSIVVGPRPRYRCRQVAIDGKITWRIFDGEGNILPPERAKVFVSNKRRPPRILFKDPREQIWVEPESFYSYDDERFYKDTGNNSFEHRGGLSILPVKATAWHGPHCNSYLFEYEGEKIFFSSDTYYDPELWKKLPETRTNTTKPDADSFVINGDINPYIEKTWSKERLKRALSFYDEELTVVHDVTTPGAKVHTGYNFLENRQKNILLTHSPDEFTALHPMAHLKKTFHLRDNIFYEETRQGEKFPLTGDCFHKKYSRFFVGFKNKNGQHRLIKKEAGSYDVIATDEDKPSGYKELYKLDLYEDIGGEYFPALNAKNQAYVQRPDGQVELQIYKEKTTTGKIVSGQRRQLTDEEQAL